MPQNNAHVSGVTLLFCIICYCAIFAKILRKIIQPLTSKHYRRLKRYEVIKISDTQKLIESGSGENDDSNIRYYCKMEELFDVLETAHFNTGHKRTRGKTLFCF
jgi:hypothetical protein